MRGINIGVNSELTENVAEISNSEYTFGEMAKHLSQSHFTPTNINDC